MRFVMVLLTTSSAAAQAALIFGQKMAIADNELVFSAYLQGLYDIYRMDIAHRIIVPVIKDEAPDTQPVWSSDGQQIAFTSYRDNMSYTIYRMDAQGRNLSRLSDDGAEAFDPAWSPDGRYISFIKRFPISNEIMLYELQSGTSRRLTNNLVNEAISTWSPDGRFLTFRTYDNQGLMSANVFNLDIQSGEISPLFAAPNMRNNLNWSRDGHTMIYADQGPRPGIYLWDTISAKITLIYAAQNANAIYRLNWSPDERFVIFESIAVTQNKLFLLDIAACLQRTASCTPQSLPLPPGIYANPSWRPS